MNKTFTSTLFFIIISLNCFSQNQRNLIDSIVNKELKKMPDVGLVIGIFKNSKTNYYSYGNQKKNETKRMDSTTVFEIGSATKTFTTLLLALEIQKQNIKQFDFIDNYIPKEINLNCQLKNKILITDLASHQSGLPNLSNDNYFSDLMKKDPSNPFRFVDEKYLFDILKSTHSLTNYRQYQYNNYAFSILGIILERKSKVKYERMIEEQILKPLKMSFTSFKVLDDKNTAGLYNQEGEIQKPMILNKVNPAGGLKSNAVDLIKYLKAFLSNNEFINEKKLIEKTYYEDNDKKIGLGWEIDKDIIEKDGDTFGNSTLIRYSPKRQIAIVILSNHQNGKLVRDLMTNIYDKINE